MAYTPNTKLKGLWPTETEEDIDSLSRSSETVYDNKGGGAQAEIPVWCARHACYIEKVEFVPIGAFTADTSDYDTFTVLKRTTAASYTTTAAVAAADTSATSMAAFTPFELSTYGTAAARTLAAGDILTFSIVDAGTTTEPIGSLVVTYRKEDA